MEFSTSDTHHNSFASHWDQIFTAPRSLAYEMENKPYIEIRNNLNAIEPIIRSFVLGSENSGNYGYQLPIVEAFCAGLSLEALATPEIHKQLAEKTAHALLDDRSNKRGTTKPRKYLGPLTMSDLFTQLQKPVRRVTFIIDS